MTKEQYEFWRNQPETEEFFQVVSDLVEDYKERLGEVAGTDSLNDRYSAGIIKALKEIQSIDFVTGE